MCTTSAQQMWNLLVLWLNIYVLGDCCKPCKNCVSCHHHCVFKGHNVSVHIVVLNCQKCNQCLKCQVSSGHKYLGLLFEVALKMSCHVVKLSKWILVRSSHFVFLSFLLYCTVIVRFCMILRYDTTIYDIRYYDMILLSLIHISEPTRPY